MSGAAGSTGATYPVGTIAKLLLMTERNVSGLALRGVIPKAERGRYELVPVVQAYIRYLRERAAGLDEAGGTGDVGASRARLYMARARVAEMEAGQLDGSLVEISHAAEMVEADYNEVRTKLLAIAPEHAPQLHRCKTVREVQEQLAELIFETLEALSRGGLRQPGAKSLG